MSARAWPFVVHDARGDAHRGVVRYATSLRSAALAPSDADAFAIVLLAAPADVASAPERTAICVPARLSARATEATLRPQPPAPGAALTLVPERMAAYAGGIIVAAAALAIAPADLFPADGDRPRFDELALALVEAAGIETIAAYTALIRHELRLAPGADALLELEQRLTPPEPDERPPRRAPAVLRLAAVLTTLRDRRVPASSLEQVADDLRVLRLFARDGVGWPRAALARLLTDVQPTPGAASRTRRGDGVVPRRRPKGGR
ncbi:MAG: hypothetical protein IVW36_04345 [Dehalococcoidia bacterium]|nr:hypothetical protein [Dehalococcoidia bacterium]